MQTLARVLLVDHDSQRHMEWLQTGAFEDRRAGAECAARGLPPDTYRARWPTAPLDLRRGCRVPDKDARPACNTAPARRN